MTVVQQLLSQSQSPFLQGYAKYAHDHDLGDTVVVLSLQQFGQEYPEVDAEIKKVAFDWGGLMSGAKSMVGPAFKSVANKVGPAGYAAGAAMSRIPGQITRGAGRAGYAAGAAVGNTMSRIPGPGRLAGQAGLAVGSAVSRVPGAMLGTNPGRSALMGAGLNGAIAAGAPGASMGSIATATGVGALEGAVSGAATNHTFPQGARGLPMGVGVLGGVPGAQIAGSLYGNALEDQTRSMIGANPRQVVPDLAAAKTPTALGHSFQGANDELEAMRGRYGEGYSSQINDQQQELFNGVRQQYAARGLPPQAAEAALAEHTPQVHNPGSMPEGQQPGLPNTATLYDQLENPETLKVFQRQHQASQQQLMQQISSGQPVEPEVIRSFTTSQAVIEARRQGVRPEQLVTRAEQLYNKLAEGGINSDEAGTLLGAPGPGQPPGYAEGQQAVQGLGQLDRNQAAAKQLNVQDLAPIASTPAGQELMRDIGEQTGAQTPQDLLGILGQFLQDKPMEAGLLAIGIPMALWGAYSSMAGEGGFPAIAAMLLGGGAAAYGAGMFDGGADSLMSRFMGSSAPGASPTGGPPPAAQPPGPQQGAAPPPGGPIPTSNGLPPGAEAMMQSPGGYPASNIYDEVMANPQPFLDQHRPTVRGAMMAKAKATKWNPLDDLAASQMPDSVIDGQLQKLLQQYKTDPAGAQQALISGGASPEQVQEIVSLLGQPGTA